MKNLKVLSTVGPTFNRGRYYPKAVEEFPKKLHLEFTHYYLGEWQQKFIYNLSTALSKDSHQLEYSLLGKRITCMAHL